MYFILFKNDVYICLPLYSALLYIQSIKLNRLYRKEVVAHQILSKPTMVCFHALVVSTDTNYIVQYIGVLSTLIRKLVLCKSTSHLHKQQIYKHKCSMLFAVFVSRLRQIDFVMRKFGVVTKLSWLNIST